MSQPYSEYLQIEKELKELDNLEVELEKEKTSVKVVNEPKKQTKLSYKDQREYDSLPNEIEELENKIAELNSCLADPKNKPDLKKRACWLHYPSVYTTSPRGSPPLHRL
jgi:predicted  nucleic acid-binding Zn-ribbon protein